MAEYARVRRAHLQTPIRHYVHPDTGRRITLVATIHIGQPGYYADLAAAITEREAAGALVHCEGSTQRTAANLAAADLTDPEREVLTALQRASLLTATRIPELGWTDQRQALPTADTWHTVDISPLEVIRRAGTDALLRRARATCRRLDWPDGAVLAPNLFRLQTAVALRLIAADNRLIQRLLARRSDPTIVHHRTRVALDGAHATTRDVVLVWGAAHLPGMQADLRARGYTLAGETWHTAARLPSALGAIGNILRRRAPRAHPAPVKVTA